MPLDYTLKVSKETLKEERIDERIKILEAKSKDDVKKYHFLDPSTIQINDLDTGSKEKNAEKRKVLFICTHNSARSQMAEGLLRALYGEHYDVYSAGTKPSKVNPYAIKVMLEIGIDISTHRSKSIEEFRGMRFDYVVTVCDNAKETCPFFPGGKTYLHKGFEDPSKFKGEEKKILAKFREVRDEIKNWIERTFGEKSS